MGVVLKLIIGILRVKSREVFGGLIVFLLSIFPNIVLAEITFCNQTDDKLFLAFGYSQQGQVQTSGWMQLESGQCKVGITKSLDDQYFYYRATNNLLGREFAGKFPMCTKSPWDIGLIKGVENCEARGYKTENFRRVDVGGNRASWTENIQLSTGPVILLGPTSIPESAWNDAFTLRCSGRSHTTTTYSWGGRDSTSADSEVKFTIFPSRLQYWEVGTKNLSGIKALDSNTIVLVDKFESDGYRNSSSVIKINRITADYEDKTSLKNSDERWSYSMSGKCEKIELAKPPTKQKF